MSTSVGNMHAMHHVSSRATAAARPRNTSYLKRNFELFALDNALDVAHGRAEPLYFQPSPWKCPSLPPSPTPPPQQQQQQRREGCWARLKRWWAGGRSNKQQDLRAQQRDLDGDIEMLQSESPMPGRFPASLAPTHTQPTGAAVRSAYRPAPFSAARFRKMLRPLPHQAPDQSLPAMAQLSLQQQFENLVEQSRQEELCRRAKEQANRRYAQQVERQKAEDNAKSLQEQKVEQLVDKAIAAEIRLARDKARSEYFAKKRAENGETYQPERQRRPRPFGLAPKDITAQDVSSLSDRLRAQYLKEDEPSQIKKQQEAKAEAKAKAEEEEKQRVEQEKREAEERAQRELARRQKIVKGLNDEWQKTVQDKLAIRSAEASVDDAGKITRGDLARLLPTPGGAQVEGWLNDQVINEYLGAVVSKKQKEDGYEKRKGMTPKVHAFNSQFRTTFNQRGHAGVARWASRAEINGTKLLDVEQILIPTCNGVHWTLLAISGTKRTITHYDSLGGNGTEYLRMATEWLKGELGNAYKEEEWTTVVGDSNRQQNSMDCGVFCAMNAHALAVGRQPDLVFPSSDASDARMFMAAVLMGADLL